MKVRNNTGPSTVPCGMPDFGDCHDDLNPLTQTHCLRFVRKLLSQESEERENPSADKFTDQAWDANSIICFAEVQESSLYMLTVVYRHLPLLYEEAELCDGGVIRKKRQIGVERSENVTADTSEFDY